MARVFHNGSISRDSVPVWSYVRYLCGAYVVAFPVSEHKHNKTSAQPIFRFWKPCFLAFIRHQTDSATPCLQPFSLIQHIGNKWVLWNRAVFCPQFIHIPIMWKCPPLLTIFCRADNNSVNQQIFRQLARSHPAVSHFKSVTAEW